jgi:septal ring factor EnvC (AmiA/AmiB activator)
VIPRPSADYFVVVRRQKVKKLNSMSINAVHSFFQTIMTDKGKGRNTTQLAGEIAELEKKRARLDEEKKDLDEEIAKKNEDLDEQSNFDEQLEAVRNRMKNADRTHDDPMDLVFPSFVWRPRSRSRSQRMIGAPSGSTGSAGTRWKPSKPS